MNILKLFREAARAHPQRPALRHGPQLLLDQQNWLRAVQGTAGWLVSQGLRPADRLVLCATNRPDYLLLMYGALWAGLVIVPVNTKLHARELSFVVEHCGARALACDHWDELEPMNGLLRLDFDDTLNRLAAHAPLDLQDSADDDLAWLFYTSGTTGRPKGAQLTHGNLLAMTLCYRSDVEPVAPDDEVLYTAPMSHGAGLYTFAYAASAACHVVPASGGFDAEEVLDLAQAAPDDRLCFFAAPTMVARLVDAAQRRGCDGRGIKCIVYGGGPMYLAVLLRSLDILGPRFAQIYGQGESPMTITCLTRAEVLDARLRGDHARLASVGRSHSLVDVRVVDGDGQPCPDGQPGEVVVRGPTVMKGYWQQPEATAAALRQDWLHTGDIGAFDEQGFLTLLDRSKDVIISGGSNIYPREVEEVLLEHPGVREACVVGAPDPEWGEKVVAFVVMVDATVTDEQLDALCLSRIARFKRPKVYVRLDQLPKNHNGKVLKTALRDRYRELNAES